MDISKARAVLLIRFSVGIDYGLSEASNYSSSSLATARSNPLLRVGYPGLRRGTARSYFRASGSLAGPANPVLAMNEFLGVLG
jgi:hypothetical protein